MLLKQIQTQVTPQQFDQIVQEVAFLYKQNRQGVKDRSPVTLLERKHLKNCQVLPSRLDLLDELKEYKKVAEIGVADGDFSKAILERTDVEELHLVDSWDSDRYSAGRMNCEQKFEKELQEGKIIIHQGLSTDMIPTLQDDYYDWVYIDTDHSYVLTAQELQLVASKVKKGGFICGHDFCTGNVVGGVPYGVIEACHEFAKREEWEYRYITFESEGHFSFALQKLEK